jgi:hypothetical protein
MNGRCGHTSNTLSSAVVALLVIMAFAAFGGCGGNDNDDDVRGADARSGGQAQVSGTPLFGGSLEQGRRYRTRAFQPALSFVVHDDNWFARETESRTLVILDGGSLEPGSNERPRPMFLAFQRYRQVYDPDRPGEGPASTMPAPRDFTVWLMRHPDLAATQPSRTRVAGLPARQVDAVLTTGKPRHRHGLPECRVDCVALAPDAWFGQGWKVRFIVLDRDRAPLVITVEALPRDFARLSARTRRVLKSVRFGHGF